MSDSDADDVPEGMCPSCMQVRYLTFTCSDCGDIKYCGMDCAVHDYEVHGLICKSFDACRDERRPSHHHRRGILFNHNGNISFEWVKATDTYQFEMAPIFGEGVFVEGRLYDPEGTQLDYALNSQEITIFSPADALEEPSNKAIKNLSPLPIVFDARGHYLAVGDDDDLNSCDFRALVDWLGSLDYNTALVDSSRYYGIQMSGIISTTPFEDPNGPRLYPNMQYVRFSPNMFFLSHHILQSPRLRLVEEMLHICYVEKIQKWDDTETYQPTWLHAVEMELDAKAKVPRSWFDHVDIAAKPGTMLYVRRDGQPLLHKHLLVLEMFVKHQVNLATDDHGYVWKGRLREEMNRPAFDAFLRDAQADLAARGCPPFPFT